MQPKTRNVQGLEIRRWIEAAWRFFTHQAFRVLRCHPIVRIVITSDARVFEFLAGGGGWTGHNHHEGRMSVQYGSPRDDPPGLTDSPEAHRVRSHFSTMGERPESCRSVTRQQFDVLR